MITTGSKFFLGVGVYGFVAAFAYALASENEMFGLSVLLGLGVAGVFAAFVLLAFRDGEVATAVLPDGLPEDEATIGPGALVSPSFFPVIGAFGAAVLVIGLAYSKWVTYAGAIVLVGVAFEWTVQAWADRASDDAEYNRGLRNRIMHPVEFPILGALAVGLVIFGFSRIMLSVNKHAAVVVFIAVAGLVVLVAAVMAGLRRIGGDVVVATLMFGGMIILTAGVIGAVQGERSFAEHEGEGANTESVSDVANVAATFTVTASGFSPTTLSVPRSAITSVTFNNTTGTPHRFVVEGDEDGKALFCGGAPEAVPECATGFVSNDQTTFLTFRVNLPGNYTFFTEGPDGTDRVEGTLVVS